MPHAALEIEQARTWWSENRPAAPGLFTSELLEAVRQMTHAPRSFPPYKARMKGEIRRALMPVARYHVYYEYDAGAARIRILSVWNAVRGRRPALRVR